GGVRRRRPDRVPRLRREGRGGVARRPVGSRLHRRLEAGLHRVLRSRPPETRRRRRDPRRQHARRARRERRDRRVQRARHRRPPRGERARADPRRRHVHPEALMAWEGPPAPYRIETERLVIRCYEPGDAALMKDAIDSSLEHLRAWMPWAEAEPQTLAEKAE